MSDKNKSDKCVLCLKKCDKLTKEHLIPKSWYPDSTPSSVQRLTFPSCKKCNNEYSKIEEKLLTALSHCIDPEDEAVKGLFDKQKRSMNQSKGRDNKDANSRQNKKENFRKQLINNPKDVPQNAFLTGFGIDENIQDDNILGLLIPCEELDKFSEKITKGVTYLDSDKYIDPDQYQIEISIYKKPINEAMLHHFNSKSTTFLSSNIATIKRSKQRKDPTISSIYLKIWNKLEIWSKVKKDSLLK
ncbi:MAG: hypothetical protein HRT90_02195 [Candidatus Margulisbacteria bacterium]|nr:hypothetical protein [Candidatus Margulisiibacteriota bacterium]